MDFTSFMNYTGYVSKPRRFFQELISSTIYSNICVCDSEIPDVTLLVLGIQLPFPSDTIQFRYLFSSATQSDQLPNPLNFVTHSVPLPSLFHYTY